jgi:hypothetical protein
MRIAIDARQELDVLHSVDEGADAPAKPADDPAVVKAKKDPLGVDAQISAALLLLRLELNGAQL